MRGRALLDFMNAALILVNRRYTIVSAIKIACVLKIQNIFARFIIAMAVKITCLRVII